MNVNGETAAGIQRSLEKFTKSWSDLDETRRAVALKVLLICELLGGRTRAAELSGFGDNTWDNYRHGKTEPRPSKLEKMAEIAGIPREYLGKDWSYENGVILVDGVDVLFGAVQSVPRFNSVSETTQSTYDAAPVLYSPGYDDITGHREGTVMVPKAFWAKMHVDPKNVLVTTNRGSGMAPTIADGAPMFIDRGDRSLQDGHIYLFDIHQEMLVRRVQRRMDGGIDLLADNSALHPVQRLEKDDVSELVVVGRVCSSNSIL